MEIVVAGVTVIRAVDSAGLDHFGKRLHSVSPPGDGPLVQQARPDMTAADAMAAVNLVRYK